MTCSNYDKHGQGCNEKGEFTLFAPDGVRNPGGPFCKKHTEGVILEYQEKLGQEWYAESVDDLGRIIPLTPLITANYIRHFRAKADV